MGQSPNIQPPFGGPNQPRVAAPLMPPSVEGRYGGPPVQGGPLPGQQPGFPPMNNAHPNFGMPN